MPPTPSISEGKAYSSVCVWLTIFIFLVSSASGGALIALYILLPLTDKNFWYPIAGMALIGIPWGVWIFNCVFRSVEKSFSSIPMSQANSSRNSSFRCNSLVLSNSVRSGGFESSMIDSPGKPRKVRFGGVTVLAAHKEEDENGGGRNEGSGGASHLQVYPTEEESNLESEKPLALSMVYESHVEVG